jgi:hypothetical protein
MADLPVAAPPFTRPRSEPTLKDLLDLHKKDIMLSLNSHAIATIQSFNAAKQTVSATVNYKKTYRELNPTTGDYDAVLKDYPALIDIPVIVLGGQVAFLSLPINVGDECVILFNDRDMDNWFAGSNSNGPATGRLHNFSDGIALIGIRSSTKALADYDTERAVLANGDAKVAVGPNLITIANSVTSLLEVINGLIDLLSGPGQGFNGITPSPGNPLNAAAATALQQYKNMVEELLE